MVPKVDDENPSTQIVVIARRSCQVFRIGVNDSSKIQVCLMIEKLIVMIQYYDGLMIYYHKV